MLNNTHSPKIRVSDHSNQGIPRHWFWLGLIIAIVLVLAAGGLYLKSQNELKRVKNDLEQAKSNPDGQARQSNDELISQIGKLIILPQDEKPTIATVSDLTKLRSQPFFAKAETGDKVLIYANAKKAILYRPGTNQIIELAPLNDDGQAGNPVEAPRE